MAALGVAAQATRVGFEAAQRSAAFTISLFVRLVDGGRVNVQGQGRGEVAGAAAAPPAFSPLSEQDSGTGALPLPGAGWLLRKGLFRQNSHSNVGTLTPETFAGNEFPRGSQAGPDVCLRLAARVGMGYSCLKYPSIGALTHHLSPSICGIAASRILFGPVTRRDMSLIIESLALENRRRRLSYLDFDSKRYDAS